MKDNLPCVQGMSFQLSASHLANLQKREPRNAGERVSDITSQHWWPNTSFRACCQNHRVNFQIPAVLDMNNLFHVWSWCLWALVSSQYKFLIAVPPGKSVPFRERFLDRPRSRV